MKKLHLALLAFLTLYSIQSLGQRFYEGIDGEITFKNNPACRQDVSENAGIQCLRVYADHKTPEKALELAKKYAVVVVMLRGIPGGTVERPLLTPTEQGKCKDFIRKFFDSTDYLQYILQADIEPNEVYKIKGGRRVAVDARVNYQKLTNDLIIGGYKKATSF